MAKDIKNSWLANYIRSNPLQVTLQIIGVGVLLLNIWLTTKLAPMVQDLALVKFQVHAMQQQLNKTTAPEETEAIRDAIKEMKDSMIRLENKVDRIIEKMIE